MRADGKIGNRLVDNKIYLKKKASKKPKIIKQGWKRKRRTKNAFRTAGGDLWHFGCGGSSNYTVRS